MLFSTKQRILPFDGGELHLVWKGNVVVLVRFSLRALSSEDVLNKSHSFVELMLETHELLTRCLLGSTGFSNRFDISAAETDVGFIERVGFIELGK
jgi:hypothetical protein